MDLYKDPARSPEQRADDLLSRMDLDEKVVQLGGIWAMQLLVDCRFSTERAAQLIKNGIGQVCRVGVGTTLEPEDIRTYVNDLQRFLVENTRLGIPALVHEECLDGFMAKQATIFPQAIGLASTWDPELVREIATTIRGHMLSVGVRQGLAPVLDVSREPRWGRIEETYGEDPYLIAALGVAYVKGLQGDDVSQGVVATLKHFAGYGKAEGGLNLAPADIPARMLREVYLYPFERAVKEAGALSVMNAYNEIDGIPCVASHELLTRILRHEWGFKGIVVSDYFAVIQLQRFHHTAASPEEAALQALGAGTDQELPTPDCMNDKFKQLIRDGKFPLELIDNAVRRVLKLKLMLGLFDRPFIQEGSIKKVFDTPGNRDLALKAARESIVLLKNEGDLLPLKRNIKRLAVIGPNAHSPRNQLGDYTYPAQAQLMGMTAYSLECQLPHEEVQADRMTVPVVSIFDGIRKKASGKCKVRYAAGCDITGDSREGFEQAVRAARSVDAVIMVMGGKSGQTPECTCGEMRDRTTLTLPGVQEALLKEVYEAGKPVVLVIIDGRPLSLGWIAEKIPAIIEAWLPGEEGGSAVADVLFGEFNPCGKLPVSFPRSVGQLPVYYGLKPSGGQSQYWGEYVDSCTGPMYEFGFGLSYTDFRFTNLEIDPPQIKGKMTVRIGADITNTGETAGVEVVQLYVNDVVASVSRPVKQLVGFQRLQLDPGETRRAEFELPIDALAFYNGQMDRVIEPGVFKVMMGRSSSDILLQGEFEFLQ